ncbi:MAG: hypothetical protein J1F23_06405 [Oscillospiraceae bacterium]|nr:hypothetical protein [Oscillospiraceae bacterium]
MAKKVKTPEEVQASQEKKSARRKLFFGTFTKALAFFLAVALTFTLAMIAFSPAPATGTAAGNDQGTSTDGGDDDDDLWGDIGGDQASGDNQTSGDVTGGGSTAAGDDNAAAGGDSTAAGDNSSTGGNTTGGNTQTSAKPTDAEIATALNNATAKAASAGYHWARNCEYTKDGVIKVTTKLGDATGILNSAIQAIYPEEDINSVVGGFIGHGKKEADVPKGAKEVEGMDAKYMLRAMNLSASDFQKTQVQGNVYQVQLKDCNNPKKDGKNALHHATNDFIVHEEVATAITDAIGSAIKLDTSNVTFNRIIIKATIDNGNLTDLVITYRFAATLGLKVAVANVTGEGKADTEIHYSNFKY